MVVYVLTRDDTQENGAGIFELSSKTTSRNGFSLGGVGMESLMRSHQQRYPKLDLKLAKCRLC